MLAQRLSDGPDVLARGTTMGAESKGIAKRARERNRGRKRTCAGCDCELDDSAIKVKSHGKTVEVCSTMCAVKLEDGHVSTGATRRA